MEPLPPFSLGFSHTRDCPDPPPAATDCQSFVSRLASLSDPRARQPGSAWLDNHERAGEAVAEFRNDIHDRLIECASHSCREANQDDSGRLVSTRVYEQTEILVFSQKHPRFRTGQRENRLVFRARIDFYDCRDVVAGGAKSGDDGEVAALVGHELHGLVPSFGGAFADEDDFFVGQRVGRVTHRRVDVLARQARVRVQEIPLGCAFAQFAKDQLNGDPRPADHRLTKHHTRVHFDAICECHVKARWSRCG